MGDVRRDKGEGSIYPTTRKTKDGEIVYWAAKYKAPNMTKPKVKYGKTESEAKRLLRQMKQDITKNSLIEIKKLSVKQYMDNWLYKIKEGSIKPRSFDTIEGTLKNNVYPYIGNFQIASLSASDVQDMINELKAKNLSYSTIKKAYDAVKACFNKGIEREELVKNPCIGVDLPKAKKKKVGNIRFLNDDEVEIVTRTSTLKYGNGKMMYRLGYAVIFLMYTGLRIGEFRALTWDNIDFENKTVIIVNSAVRIKNRDENVKKDYILLIQDDVKTESSERVVPLSNKAMEAILELQKLNGRFKYDASTSKDKIINERAFDRMLRAILVRGEIEPCGAHVLRHTFASMLFRKGVDVKQVSELLGHKDVAFTYNIYIHLIKEQKRQAIDLLDDL